MNKINYYLVVSREYRVTIPILDDGSGPDEYCREIAYVSAGDVKEAKIIGLKMMRKMPDARHWIDDGENPFKGMEVHKITKYHYEKAAQ